MEILYEQLNIIDIPIWINKNKEIKFINNKFKETFNIKKYDELENENLKYIIEDNKLGYTEDLSILNENYKKLMIPINLQNTNMGILIKNNIREKDLSMSNLIIDTIPEIIFCKDKNLNYTIINKECEEFYKCRGIDNILGKTDLDLPLDRDFVETCTRNDKLVIEKRKSLYTEEKSQDPNSGKTMVYEIIKTPIIDSNGNVHGLVGSVRDVSRQKEIEEKLRILSYRDMLTGLYNRTYFDEKISEILKEEDFSIGVVVGDLNGLKIVNDAFGHLEGDKYIKYISKILKDTCKENGFVFRWGGDEFITLLMNSSEEDCKEYIETINKICKEKSKSCHEYSIGISQGYAMFNPSNNEIYKVLKEADKMLYSNKSLNKRELSKLVLDSINEKR